MLAKIRYIISRIVKFFARIIKKMSCCADTLPIFFLKNKSFSSKSKVKNIFALFANCLLTSTGYKYRKNILYYVFIYGPPMIVFIHVQFMEKSHILIHISYENKRKN
jgi:hypothetical protein